MINCSTCYCPECAHQISDQTITCPNCGFPIAQRRQLQQPQPLPTPAVPVPLPQSNQNNQAVTNHWFGYLCSNLYRLASYLYDAIKNEQTKTTTKTVTAKTQTDNSSENPDTCMIPIPMVLAGNAENGRYFLMARIVKLMALMKSIIFVLKTKRLKDQAVTYGRMQIQCGANKKIENTPLIVWLI